MPKKIDAKPLLIIAGTTLIIVGVIAYVVLRIGGKEKPPRVPQVATVRNPSPLNPAQSPNVDQAQKQELEWLKKHGKYFRWGDDPLVQGRRPVKQAEPKPMSAMFQEAPKTNDAERRMIWETFWKEFPPVRTASAGAILSSEDRESGGTAASKAETPAQAFPFRIGCPVKGKVLRATYASLKAETPLFITVTDPANCAGVPYGSIITAKLKADYSTFRGVAKVESVSLPDGSVVEAKGVVLGPDGLPGVGYQVVRNDRKTLGLASLFEGISAGFHAAREDSVETTCYEWGCKTETKRSDDRLREGIVEGVSAFAGGIADGIVGEYRQVSPIVVTVPEGFPVEVVFEG